MKPFAAILATALFLSSGAWAGERCHALFSNLGRFAGGSEVLDHLVKKVKSPHPSGRRWVVIFDLDETIINSRERALRVLRDLAFEPERRRRFPLETEKLLLILRGDLTEKGFNLKSHPGYPREVLVELGVNSKAFADDIDSPQTRPYNSLYYSNAYARSDVAMPGAVRFLGKLDNVIIVYLTGRHESMRDGSVENIERVGLPAVNPKRGVYLIMNGEPRLMDAEYKRRALRPISDLGEIAGGFENEPKNINSFIQAFPTGKFAWVQSTHSRNSGNPDPRVYRIVDFVGR